MSDQTTIDFEPTQEEVAAQVPEVEDISFGEAKEDQAPPVAQAPAQQKEDIEDILVSKAEPKTWVIGPEGNQRELIQREMNFIQKIQWFSLLGSVLEDALKGEDGLRINNLLSAPGGRPGNLSMSDFRDADTFVMAVGKVLSVAPDFLLKSYCIWLGVPDYEKDYTMELMKLPASLGGLTDEQGLGIIEVFIDQNYQALDNFFRVELPKLAKRAQARAKEAQERNKA